MTDLKELKGKGRNENQKMKEQDNKHFTAIVNVAVSEQIFGWVCGFGKRMKIVSPSPVVEDFKKHLDKMRDMYL